MAAGAAVGAVEGAAEQNWTEIEIVLPKMKEEMGGKCPSIFNGKKNLPKSKKKKTQNEEYLLPKTLNSRMERRVKRSVVKIDFQIFFPKIKSMFYAQFTL